MLQENLSLAPMMEISDAHFRSLLRGCSKKTVLYSEMIVDDIIHHGPNNLDYFIGRSIEEHPSVIQLGGFEPERLAAAAEICERAAGDYGEININCGCPSQRVSKRSFGAKLMLEPDLVREIVSTMTRRVQVPITVKCRIGVDANDSYDELCNFIASAHAGGAQKFIIHARKCILKGLTTKQNRDIPPLKYEVVHRLVRDFPELKFVLNGGILTLPTAREHCSSGWFDTIPGPNSAGVCLVDCESGGSTEVLLPPVHGVMIGRAIYNNPLMLCSADSSCFGVRDPLLTRRQILDRYIDYCEWVQSDNGPRKVTPKFSQMVSTSTLLKPVHNIMNSLMHCSAYKMLLNDLYVARVKAGNPNPSCREVIEGAMTCIRDADLDAVLGNQSDDALDGRLVLSASPHRLDTTGTYSPFRWQKDSYEGITKPLTTANCGASLESCMQIESQSVGAEATVAFAETACESITSESVPELTDDSCPCDASPLSSAN